MVPSSAPLINAAFGAAGVEPKLNVDDSAVINLTVDTEAQLIQCIHPTKTRMKLASTTLENLPYPPDSS